jgi:hypothetical protein
MKLQHRSQTPTYKKFIEKSFKTFREAVEDKDKLTGSKTNRKSKHCELDFNSSIHGAINESNTPCAFSKIMDSCLLDKIKSSNQSTHIQRIDSFDESISNT